MHSLHRARIRGRGRLGPIGLLVSFMLFVSGCDLNATAVDGSGDTPPAQYDVELSVPGPDPAGPDQVVTGVFPITPEHQALLESLQIVAVEGPDSRTVIDDFGSHTWFDTGRPELQQGTLYYDDTRSTQGTKALHIEAPVSPLGLNPTGEELDGNSVEFSTAHPLPEPEDWSDVEFVTVDLYMEENPTGLAEAKLTLESTDGQEYSVSLILGWQLFQWENPQMTFPLKDNAHRFGGVPPEILANVARVTLAVNRYSDSQLGDAAPLDEINFHIDNMRLNGTDLWDAFDGPGLNWEASTPESTTAGVTHNQGYGDSTGALVFAWAENPDDAQPAVGTNRVDLLNGGDWSGYRQISAMVKSPVAGMPLTWRLHGADGSAVDLEPVTLDGNDEWQEITWEMPTADSGFDTSSLEVVQIIADTTVDPGYATGHLWIDDVTVTQLDVATSVDVTQQGGDNVIDWINPIDPNVDRVAVLANVNGYPTSLDNASLLCIRTIEDFGGQCEHRGAGSTPWYYTVVAVDDTTATYIEGESQAQIDRTPIEFTAPWTNYRAAFSAENGALLHLEDKGSGRRVLEGSADDNLWRIDFINEDELPSLMASDFSAGSQTHNFSYDSETQSLVFRWDPDGTGAAGLEFIVDLMGVDQNGFDMKARMVNNTGYDVRQVVLPYKVTFDVGDVREVLLPVQEGITLQREFFEDQRTTTLTRPPLFADMLAIDSRQGELGIYMIQDSNYHAELLPGHDPAEPVFQPNTLSVGTMGDQGYLQFAMNTFVPSGGEWMSGTLRYRLRNDFRDLAEAYRMDNGFDDPERYPSLFQKLDRFGIYHDVAHSAVMNVEMFKMNEWQKANPGESFATLQNEWIPTFGTPNILHLTHWQEGRDWYEDPKENHKLEDDHPEALPIWWDAYGTEAEFLSMLGAADEHGLLRMPFTNWTVWNTVDPDTREIPALAETPAALRKLRGEQHPYLEYKGYVVKPWHPDVMARNDQMMETYTTTYPQDVMFVDMTGERSPRYTLADDNQSGSAAIYTQGVINENRRLSQQKALMTEGVFDRIADSVSGYAQSIRQKHWNGILWHLGDEYTHWLPYPFAADVMHDKVGFYQHDLNTEIWPAEDPALFTYYTTFGYNLMADATAHMGEDGWLHAVDTYQKLVNVRTFGQRMLDFRRLSQDNTLVRSRWAGADDNNLTITAKFDPNDQGRTHSIDGYTIAPDGFHAATDNGDMVAGIYVNEFNYEPLSPGVHWIAVDRVDDTIFARQLVGEDTNITIPRPEDWEIDAFIDIQVLLADGSVAEVPGADVRSNRFILNLQVEHEGQKVDAYRIRYIDPALQPVPEAPEAPAMEATSLIDPAGWDADGVNVESADGLSWFIESGDGTSGRVTSSTVFVDSAEDAVLDVGVNAVDDGSSLVIQLQAAGEVLTFLMAEAMEPGRFTLDISDVTGWTGPREFQVIMFVNGDGARVGLGHLDVLTPAPEGSQPPPVAEPPTEEPPAEEPPAEEPPAEEPPAEEPPFEPPFEVAPPLVAAWFDDFAGSGNWVSTDLLVVENPGFLTVSADPADANGGKIESGPIDIDFSNGAELDVHLAGAEEISGPYTLQIQEEGGGVAAEFAIDPIPGHTVLDIGAVTGWTTSRTFRIVLWLTEPGATLHFDLMSIRTGPF